MKTIGGNEPGTLILALARLATPLCPEVLQFPFSLKPHFKLLSLEIVEGLPLIEEIFRSVLDSCTPFCVNECPDRRK